MVPGFGKQTITIGSAPQADIRLGGPGVAPEHARIIHQGGGTLLLQDLGAGPTLANGAPVAPVAPGGPCAPLVPSVPGAPGVPGAPRIEAPRSLWEIASIRFRGGAPEMQAIRGI